MSKIILVTGYGGFLGSAICRKLLERGYEVRGIARGSYPDLQSLGVECFQGSVADAAVCHSACQGVSGIVHTAALAGVWGKRTDFERINVNATDYLLREAKSQAIPAFVYTSSPSVTFDGSPQINVDEAAPYPKAWLCDYPRTKAIAEQRVLDSNSGQLATCALRPHLIWGVGDPHLIPRVISRCRKGRLMRVGDGKNLIDTVHVDVAAEAHVLALNRMLDRDRDAAGRPYFITDGEPIECWKWITDILSFANLLPPNRSISLANAYRVGAALELIFKLARLRSEPPMTRFVAKQLGVAHYFNIDSARKRLGFHPPTNRQEIVENMRGTLTAPD
ncbi:NAD-dependent epimerase/dehydratase family protein [Pirellulaceae bacterium SH449]